MNVVLYTRVSTIEQVEEGNSLVSQENYCRRYAEHKGLNIERVFCEKGESAKTANRTELQKMIRYCSEHHKTVDGILIYKIDRLSRNGHDYGSLKLFFGGLGIRIISATEEISDDPQGRFFEIILAGAAQLDNEMRAERSKQGMIDGVRAGRWMWVAPLGYRNVQVHSEKNIAPDRSDPLRVPLIQEAWKLIDAGYAEVEALRIISEKGLTQRNGCKVTKQAFSNMLRNKVYMGVIEAFGMTVKSDTIEPIIDEALWWRVYDRLEGKKVSPARHRAANPLYPLRRFLMCPHGHMLTASASKGGSGTLHAYYHCVHCGKGGERYRADEVHQAFGDYLDTFSFDDNIADALREAIRLNYLERNDMAEKERKAISKELTEVERGISTAMDKLMKGVLTDDQAKEYLTAREQRRREIQQRLSELGTVSLNVEQIWNFGLDVLSNLGGTWENIRDINVKQRFQRWIFPDGLSYDGEKFGTQRIACSLRIKQAINAEMSTVVPPARFERAAPALGERCSVP